MTTAAPESSSGGLCPVIVCWRAVALEGMALAVLGAVVPELDRTGTRLMWLRLPESEALPASRRGGSKPAPTSAVVEGQLLHIGSLALWVASFKPAGVGDERQPGWGLSTTASSGVAPRGIAG